MWLLFKCLMTTFYLLLLRLNWLLLNWKSLTIKGQWIYTPEWKRSGIKFFCSKFIALSRTSFEKCILIGKHWLACKLGMACLQWNAWPSCAWTLRIFLWSPPWISSCSSPRHKDFQSWESVSSRSRRWSGLTTAYYGSSDLPGLCGLLSYSRYLLVYPFNTNSIKIFLDWEPKLFQSNLNAALDP